MAAKKKSATKKPKATPPASFPEAVRSRVPAALREALPTMIEKHGGLLAYGLPFRDPNDKVAVSFDPDAAYQLMSDYGDSLPETDTFVPLAIAGRRSDNEAFAVDPSKPEMPVYFFEHEAGYHALSPSLEAFLAGLLQKGAKTPLEMLEKVVDKASKLDDREKYDDVVALLEPALVGMPRVRTFDNDTVARALNLLGIAYRNTGKTELAVATLEDAVRLGEDQASLNLCDLYEDVVGDFARSIAIAKGLVARRYLIGMYEWFWARNYLGRGYVMTGELAKATRAFHQIEIEFAVGEPEHLATAAEGLRELAKKHGGDVAQRAEAILSWFSAAPPARSAAAIAEARAWWKALPTKVRTKLAELGKANEKPSDDDLARVLRLESADLSECGIKDLSFLQPMSRLTSLDIGKNPLGDLSTLPKMDRLERLRVGETSSFKSTKGIEHAPNLEHFYARDCKLTALHGVERLASLEELDIANNKVSDLKPLAKLTELTELTIYENDVRVLGPLAGCARLKQITCFGNEKLAKGLLALAELPRLASISAVSWEISEKEMRAFSQARPDVELEVEGVARRKWPPRKTTDADRAWWASLAAHPELREALRSDRLDAEKPIDEQLGKLVDEDHVFVAGAGVKSVEPLATMSSLSFVDIARNPVVDLSPLAGLRHLEQLRASATRVNDLTTLGKLSKLIELDVAETDIASLGGLEGCRNLRDLSIADTKVASLEPLAATSELREIDIGGTGVADLGPLARHRHLRRLDCSATPVTDLAPLAACTDLRRIDCFGLATLRGLGALAKLPRLRAVYSRGRLPSADMEAFRKARPDVDVD